MGLGPAACGLGGGARGTASPGAGGCGHGALMGLMRSGVATGGVVSSVHTLAMIAAGLAMAWVVYRYLGLRSLTRSWLNLEMVWGASLVVTGAVSCALALATPS